MMTAAILTQVCVVPNSGDRVCTISTSSTDIANRGAGTNDRYFPLLALPIVDVPRCLSRHLPLFWSFLRYFPHSCRNLSSVRRLESNRS
jgi:hypothetical protein